MGINDTLGNAIFLTWDGTLKKLPDARRLARRMRELGTTFRGCSFDRKVSYREECPVCGQAGLKVIDTPWDHEETRQGPRQAPPARSHWQPGKRKARP
jgi:hypothetical protein